MDGADSMNAPSEKLLPENSSQVFAIKIISVQIIMQAAVMFIIFAELFLKYSVDLSAL
jgi:hypothetical protein